MVAGQLGQIEEFLFEDQLEDGSSRQISAYRVRFASGFRVEALSSRPENIRGLQGVVVIDEAAFHKNVRAVLDAVNALLIWGGRIRVISTHNGKLNPFNELINEAKAGKVPFSLHFIPFQAAVDNGLFKRVCLLRGMEYSAEAEREWEAKIRGAYGLRTAQMRQELDAIPADAEGTALSQVVIESVTSRDIPVIRWTLGSDFAELTPDARKRIAMQSRQARAPAPFPADAIGDRLTEETSGDIAAMIAQIETMVATAGDLDELRTMLLAAYPDLDTSKLTAAIALGLTSAAAAGMSDVEDESA